MVTKDDLIDVQAAGALENVYNSLSRIFSKNFMKVMVLLNKLLKSVDLTEYFLCQREFLVFVHYGFVTRHKFAHTGGHGGGVWGVHTPLKT